MKIIQPILPVVPLFQLSTGENFSYDGIFYILTDEMVDSQWRIVNLATGVVRLMEETISVTRVSIEARVLP